MEWGGVSVVLPAIGAIRRAVLSDCEPGSQCWTPLGQGMCVQDAGVQCAAQGGARPHLELPDHRRVHDGVGLVCGVRYFLLVSHTVS